MLKRWINRRLEQWRSDTIPYADPLRAGRHPFQIYLLALAFVSGLTQLIGASPPDSLSRQLPAWLVYVWSWMLVVGSAAGLCGSLWPQKDYATGLTIERVGLMATGVAGVLYGAMIPYNLGLSGAVAGGVTIGFGLACIIRAQHIGKIFKRALDPDPPEVDTEEGR